MDSLQNNIHEQIKKWVMGPLSTPQQLLGGLPPCPYASEALLRKQVKIKLISEQIYIDEVEKELNGFINLNRKMSLLIVENGRDVDPLQAQEFVGRMREEYYAQDLWLLYDHPNLKEEVGDFVMNQGNFLLFMIQRLSDLVFASRDLMKTKYYEQWDSNYYDEVVLHREKYYLRMLSEKQNQTSVQV